MEGAADSQARVVIAGGGIAGLEAALALADLAGDRVRLSLLAPEPEFLFKPLAVEEPFTFQPAERHELAPALAEIGGEFIEGALREVDAGAHEAVLGDGSRLPYDYLFVCVGGRTRAAFTGVETFWSDRTDVPVDELIARADASPARMLNLIVPPGTSWPLPLYEIGLLIRRRAEELGMPGLAIRILTPEHSPLAIFGSVAGTAVSELLAARRISVETERYVVQDAEGRVRTSVSGELLDPDLALALPVISGPAITGLPADAGGFIPVDLHGRVSGTERVFAAGDGTTFPVKQGGIATQLADAGAAQIAAELGAAVDPKPFDPVLRGQLITGAESLHMKHELTGGHGEGKASLDYLWWPPQKVGGRYLAAWLGHTTPTDLEPPSRPIDVEVSWPHEWHGELLSYDAEPRDGG